MKKDEPSTIGELIVQKRDVLDWSQDELAFQSGLSRKALSKIETGKSIPHLPTFHKIAKALGMKGSELFKEIEDRGLIDDLLRNRGKNKEKQSQTDLNK